MEKWLRTAFFQAPDVSAQTGKRLVLLFVGLIAAGLRGYFERLGAYVTECRPRTCVCGQKYDRHTDFLTEAMWGQAAVESQVEVEAGSSFSQPKGRTGHPSEH